MVNVPPPLIGVSSEVRIFGLGHGPISQLLDAPLENETFGPLALPRSCQKPGDVNVVNDPLVSVNGSAWAITTADRQKLISRRKRKIILTVSDRLDRTAVRVVCGSRFTVHPPCIWAIAAEHYMRTDEQSIGSQNILVWRLQKVLFSLLVGEAHHDININARPPLWPTSNRNFTHR